MIVNYIHQKHPRDQGKFLPETTEASSVLSERAITCGYDEVRCSITEGKTKWCKVQQHSYSEETRASLGRYASIHGPTSAAHEFSIKLGHSVPESTARKYRDLYLKELEKQREASSSSIPTVTSLPLNSRGRPLVLGKFDDQVKKSML